MNFYAVLDDSDDEDMPKVVTKSAVKASTEKTQMESKKNTVAPPATKSNDSKSSAPKDKCKRHSTSLLIIFFIVSILNPN